LGLLNINNLNVHLETCAGMVMANNGIDLSIKNNETLGLIGETGCGKSILGHALVGLLPENAMVTGRILYDGKNLLGLSEEEMRKIRGRQIAMIFQNPGSALNPVWKFIDTVWALHQERLRR
jgi:peptide/nickel transport system ATP-binding protein